MNIRFKTAVGIIHANAVPTMQTLGDQPWQVRLRGTAGDLLLSCTVDESSAREAATEAVRFFLDCRKGIPTKEFSII